ncbi:hypothetical protein QBC43DRAFT_345679 [Cladorrhinum sp. PSN259]|nr:hypothetical protein QBC43DRAFT_345679 [Cladorrhinum sp. PSN259]
MASSSRKRKADDDSDEMSLSPLSSPAISSRQLSRPSKKVRQGNDLTGRQLSLPRLLETLDNNQLRTVLQTICERHPDIGHEVVTSAPRPSVNCAMDVLEGYRKRLQEAVPFGPSSSDYQYFRVKQPLVLLVDAISDFTPQFLPPVEQQTNISLQYLEGVTKLIHELPDWESQQYRHHKDNAYDEISRAWALVITEASKRGGGFVLHTGGWDQRLIKHNQQSGGKLEQAVNALSTEVGWTGHNPIADSNSSRDDPNSILNQLMNGTYGSPVRVGPCPGDQHSSIVNPFVEAPQRISEYTAQEIATLQTRLEKQLGPEYISSRSGPGGQKVHYITAEKIIALANEVFGFNGWSSSIQNIQVDFVDEHPQTLRVSLGLSVIVRVTLRDGTYHEDLGYGHIENCKGKAAAFEKAKKEGTTDALKRALRHFGNVLGNCIYDKAYLGKVTKIKAQPQQFDEAQLHRHSDFVVKKDEGAMVKVDSGVVTQPQTAQISALAGAPPVPQLFSADSFEDFLGELDEADFNISEEGHPDEVVLSTSDTSTISNEGRSQLGNNNNNNNTNTTMQPPARPLERAGSLGNNFSKPPPQAQPQQQPPQTPNAAPRTNAFIGTSSNNNAAPGPSRPTGQFNQSRPPPPQANNTTKQFQPKPPPAVVMTPPPNVPTAPPAGEPIGFFSARAVSKLPEDALASGQVSIKEGGQFNPKLESPSIRKTPGIDHTTSKPLSRTGQHVPPALSDDKDKPAGPAAGPAAGRPPMMSRPAPPLARGNVINPQLDQTRRIGVPGSGPSSSPLANRNQYKPPTMKRPPLSDIPSNAPVNGGNVGINGLPDAKRQRTT